MWFPGAGACGMRSCYLGEFWNLMVVTLHNSVNVLSAAELHTKKWLSLGCEYFTTIQNNNKPLRDLG